MTNEIIINVETGEETIIELKGAKLTEFNKKLADAQAEKLEAEAAANAKAETRQAILDKLGLTADEVAALLG